MCVLRTELKFSAVISTLNRRAISPAPVVWAFLNYTADEVLAAYFGVGRKDEWGWGQRVSLGLTFAGFLLLFGYPSPV